MRPTARAAPAIHLAPAAPAPPAAPPARDGVHLEILAARAPRPCAHCRKNWRRFERKTKGVRRRERCRPPNEPRGGIVAAAGVVGVRCARPPAVSFSEVQAQRYMQLAKVDVTSNLEEYWRVILGNADEVSADEPASEE